MKHSYQTYDSEMKCNQSKEIMVSIVVRAYNVSKWIRQALDSLIAQQTDYSFEIIIGEDCCTDNTLTIAKDYAARYSNIKVLTTDRNLGPVGQWIKCIQNSVGKYIMICDGDDFWHNPNKLQMQVDYMESHPECVVLHTDFNQYNDKSKNTKNDCNKHRSLPANGFVQNEIFSGRTKISNVTSCYRRDVFNAHVPVDKYLELGLLGDDYPTWVILSAYGEVQYIPISTATYRIGNVSMTREINYDKIRNRYETEKRQARWLCEMFPNLGPYEDDVYYDKYCSHQLLLTAYRNNDYSSARKFAKEDKMPNWKTRMAYTWLTFQIVQLYSRLK